MQSGELVELAAVVARQGPALLSARDGFRVVGIEEYWAASKCRFDRWGRSRIYFLPKIHYPLLLVSSIPAEVIL